jgi:hypothetical protein
MLSVVLLIQEEFDMTRKTSSIIGAGTGLALFMAVALLPAMLYGGYAGVLLAGGIFGTPIMATFAVRAFIVGGMVMGVFGIASLFTVAGAVIGSGLDALTRTGVALANTVRE